jgi:hypothetical protein
MRPFALPDFGSCQSFRARPPGPGMTRVESSIANASPAAPGTRRPATTATTSLGFEDAGQGGPATGHCVAALRHGMTLGYIYLGIDRVNDSSCNATSRARETIDPRHNFARESPGGTGVSRFPLSRRYRSDRHSTVVMARSGSRVKRLIRRAFGLQFCRCRHASGALVRHWRGAASRGIGSCAAGAEAGHRGEALAPA